MCNFKTFRWSTFSRSNGSFFLTRYIIGRLNFFQSSMLVFFNIVDKYLMAVWISGLSILVINRSLGAVVLKYCLCFSCRFSSLLLVLNKTFWCRFGCTSWQVLWILFHHTFCLVVHINFNLSWSYLVQGHTQIIMDFSSGDFHFPNLVLVLLLEVLYHHRHFLWYFLVYLNVFHIPNYIHLMPIDYFIG